MNTKVKLIKTQLELLILPNNWAMYLKRARYLALAGIAFTGLRTSKKMASRGIAGDNSEEANNEKRAEEAVEEIVVKIAQE